MIKESEVVLCYQQGQQAALQKLGGFFDMPYVSKTLADTLGSNAVKSAITNPALIGAGLGGTLGLLTSNEDDNWRQAAKRAAIGAGLGGAFSGLGAANTLYGNSITMPDSGAWWAGKALSQVPKYFPRVAKTIDTWL